jgi:hypothetical protein
MSYYGTAVVMAGLDAHIVAADDIGVHAIELAYRGWSIFPLRGKYPPAACSQCKDPVTKRWLHLGQPCPHGLDLCCHGVLSASREFAVVDHWWSGPCAGHNIAARIPGGLFVLDIDPRQPEGTAFLADRDLTATLTVTSGRNDGGRHLYYRRPYGKLRNRVANGLDVKTDSGYCVMPPSIHPTSGQPYRWDTREVAAAPRWLTDLIVVPDEQPAPPRDDVRRRTVTEPGDSIADAYTDSAHWADILTGWRVVAGDGETDGSRWRHPTATAAWSATVRHGCLFVYSTNTPFPVTEPENPHGLTKFRAYAVLHHDGDLSAAARLLREGAR